MRGGWWRGGGCGGAPLFFLPCLRLSIAFLSLPPLSPSSANTVSDFGYASSLTSATRAMALAAMATRLAPSRAYEEGRGEEEVEEERGRARPAARLGCPPPEETPPALSSLFPLLSRSLSSHLARGRDVGRRLGLVRGGVRGGGCLWRETDEAHSVQEVREGPLSYPLALTAPRAERSLTLPHLGCHRRHAILGG